MKKLKYLLLFLMVLLPLKVNAIEERSIIKGDDNVNYEEEVDGSALLAGNNVTSKSSIFGLGLLFGNNITQDGDSEYLISAGNNITVNGNIEKDAIILGNIITINSIVGRDTFITGNEVVLTGTYNRDIEIYASKVTLQDALIGRNVKINATSIEIGKNTTINGTLNYIEDAKYSIDPTASIYQTETFEVEEVENYQAPTFKTTIITMILTLGMLLVTFLSFALFTKNLFHKFEKTNSFNKVLKTFGVGILTLIVVPILSILLMITFVGIGVGVITLILYIAVLLLNYIISGYMLGSLIWHKLLKKETNIYYQGLIGITVFYILTYIPYLNGILVFLSMIFSLGLITRCFTRSQD